MKVSVSLLFPLSGLISIDFPSEICFGLDAMKAEQAIRSAEHLLEDVFRFAEGTGGHDDPAWGFSDKYGVAVAGSALKQAVLSLLPKGIGVEYRNAAHIAIHDISL
jgi:hypothetical protein